MPLEALDSVKVLAKYTPDPRGTIVSPKSGAKVHLGRAMVLGGSLPFDRAWAKTKPSPTPSHWSERTPRFSDDTQLYLATLLEDPSFTVGDTRTVNDADRPLFVSENKRTVAIQLIDRDSSHPDEDFDALLWCEATVKVTITLESGPGYSYRAKLYHNARRAAQLPEDFALVLPPLSEYAELVVYQETQARLRYIVEVETVRG
ncbi:hypothetical protein AM588_10006809 [Phytophthora nicotianae]|nr:hypothetical protein AM588_10006809 [Phytophthora nicotianae]